MCCSSCWELSTKKQNEKPCQAQQKAFAKTQGWLFTARSYGIMKECQNYRGINTLWLRLLSLLDLAKWSRIQIWGRQIREYVGGRRDLFFFKKDWDLVNSYLLIQALKSIIGSQICVLYIYIYMHAYIHTHTYNQNCSHMYDNLMKNLTFMYVMVGLLHCFRNYGIFMEGCPLFFILLYV